MSGFGEPMGDENCTYRTLTCCPKADLYTWDVANYLSQDPISWLEVEVVGGTARTRLGLQCYMITGGWVLLRGSYWIIPWHPTRGVYT